MLAPEKNAFLALIILNGVTLLCFMIVLAQLRFSFNTSFDYFHNTTIVIFLLLLCSQTAQAALCIQEIDRYDDERAQTFESVQTSLYFMFVASMFYRMRALIEGDQYLIKQLVNQARFRMYK